MFGYLKRGLAVAMASLALAGCQVIPGGDGPPQQGGPVTQQPDVPDSATLPSDASHHRVALLVPLSGTNGRVGQSIANATTMALLDTGAQDLRITTYDTANGAGAAASRAIRDGNKLILGPLMRDNVGAVLAQARPADVPLLTFSNDASVARPDVFVMGHIPEQSIARTAHFAIDQGARNFAALIPQGEYGDRALEALRRALDGRGGKLVALETFDRRNRSIVSGANRLKTQGGFDTVLIADGARLAILAANEIKAPGAGLPSIIGTELWGGEDELTRETAMRGAWFSAVSDYRYAQFARSYEERFGQQPYRIATLGYDGVLFTLRVARNWRVGGEFPTGQLLSSGGFIGVDGPIRFRSNGIGQRSMEVRQVNQGTFATVDAAPTEF